MDYYLSVLKKYAVFDGRAHRKEYWMFTLINIVISIALQLLDNVLGVYFLEIIYGLAVLIPGAAVTVRRLHDTDKVGWWVFVVLIPILGWLVLLYFMILEGDAGQNRFGPSPKQ